MTVDTTPTITPEEEASRTGQPGERPYTLLLQRHLQIGDVTRLLHYVTDFGTGDARGHEHDGGWSIRLSDISDVRLLTSQCGDLIEDLIVQETSR